MACSPAKEITKALGGGGQRQPSPLNDTDRRRDQFLTNGEMVKEFNGYNAFADGRLQREQTRYRDLAE